MYNLVAFNIFIMLFNNHKYLIQSIFIIPKRNPVPLSSHSYTPLSYSAIVFLLFCQCPLMNKSF